MNWEPIKGLESTYQLTFAETHLIKRDNAVYVVPETALVKDKMPKSPVGDKNIKDISLHLLPIIIAVGSLAVATLTHGTVQGVALAVSIITGVFFLAADRADTSREKKARGELPEKWDHFLTSYCEPVSGEEVFAVEQLAEEFPEEKVTLWAAFSDQITHQSQSARNYLDDVKLYSKQLAEARRSAIEDKWSDQPLGISSNPK
jgi:hypothetical protein